MLLKPMDVRGTTIVAETEIPAGISFVASQEMLNIGLHVENQPVVQNVLKVWYENEELISAIGLGWRAFIRAARDRHEQNLELYRQTNDTLSIRTVRHINTGEQLLVWYDTKLALEMNIPFLSFQNIRDAGSYICQECGFASEFPNPLKAHLKFHCSMSDSKADAMSSINLSKRSSPVIDRTLYGNDTHHNEIANSYCKAGFQCHTNTGWTQDLTSNLTTRQCCAAIKPERSESDSITCNVTYGFSCMDNVSRENRKLPYGFHDLHYPCSVRTTVFVKTHAGQNEMDHMCSTNHGRYDAVTSDRLCSETRLTTSHSGLPHLPRLSGSNTTDEPIDVLHRSFLALSSRRGHLCLYCGKFYSRKYGLKIHLRTHTGYKPLKCKICFRRFGDPSNLNKHVRLHAEGDTPYKCKYCGKILVRRRDLTRHIKSRHPESYE